jgi:hypothetical protein
MGKKLGSGSGIQIRDEKPGSYSSIYFMRILMRIRDGKNSDPRSGMEKIRIRDKHPGSATMSTWFDYCNNGLLPNEDQDSRLNRQGTCSNTTNGVAFTLNHSSSLNSKEV